jgi:hypothetical protein
MIRRWNTWQLKKRRKNAPKKRAIVDEALLDTYRTAGPCWWCGRVFPGREACHIFGRGQEGCTRFDVVENLCSLDTACHAANHAGQQPTTLDLLHIVAARLGTTVDAIRSKMDQLKWQRLP